MKIITGRTTTADQIEICNRVFQQNQYSGLTPDQNSASGIDKRNALLNTPIHAGLLTARIAVPKIGPTEGRNFKFG
jgi:hypothetical protein